MLSKLIEVWDTFVRTHLMAHLNVVHVIECESYLRSKKRDVNKQWALVTDMHAESFGVRYTCVCDLVMHPKTRWMDGWTDG